MHNKYTIRRCKRCNKEFTSSHYSKSFCSEECKVKFFSLLRSLNTPKKQVRRCMWCEDEFVPRQSGRDQLFCSKRCMRSYNYSKHSQWSPKEMRTMDLCEEKKDIIIGSILGDGSMVYHKTSKLQDSKCTFSMTQGERQAGYLSWKSKKLYPLIHSSDVRPYQCGKSFVAVKTSIFHPYFDYIRSQFYINNKKFIPKRFAENLTPLSMAIWYMDDGSFLKHKNSRQAVLCTDSFAKESVQYMASSLEYRFKLRTRVYEYSPKGALGKGPYPRIYILRDSVSAFFNIITEHVHPTMRYKITF